MLDAINALCDREGYTIAIPETFTTVRARYSFGQLVPLPEREQPNPQIIYFGEIVGIQLERWSDAPEEWCYVVSYPDGYPKYEYECICSELELDEALEAL